MVWDQKAYSSERVPVTCTWAKSPKCKGSYTLARGSMLTAMRTRGSIVCNPCYIHETLVSGDNHPGRKYTYDDSVLHTIDSKHKAYLLGWIASDGSVRPGRISIGLNPIDIDILYQLRDIVGTDVPLSVSTKVAYLTFSSKVMSADVCRHLNILPKEKTYVVEWPKLDSYELNLAFLRGLFDGDGCIVRPKAGAQPRATICSYSPSMRASIVAFSRFKCKDYGTDVDWQNEDAIRFVEELYSDKSYPYLQRKYDTLQKWINWKPAIPGKYGKGGGFKWSATSYDAVCLSRQQSKDADQVLTIVSKASIDGNTEWYETDIKVIPNAGLSFCVTLEDSITSQGYALTQPVTIDGTYTGTVRVPLTKVDPCTPSLSIPCRGVRITCVQPIAER